MALRTPYSVGTVLGTSSVNGRVVALLAAGIGFVWTLSGPVLSHERVTTSITFDREISRILTRKCVSCHSGGSLAFPLTTYEETRPWARAIQEEVLSRSMPPWRAVSGYGSFVNDGGLTRRELQTFVDWVEGGGPRNRDQKVIGSIGDSTAPQDKPLTRDFDRWQLGRPNLVRGLEAAAVTPPSRANFVTRTIVDLELNSDRRIRALEFRPGDRRALRAAYFWLEETGQWLASWTPWHTGTNLPGDVAYLLPAGSRIVAELHHGSAGDLQHSSGTEQTQDGGQIALYDAAGRPARCPSDFILRAEGEVPPHATNEKFQASMTLSDETTLLTLIPELHAGASWLEVRAQKPDGAVQVLLLLRDILHDWPTPYILDAPLSLPQGTELSVTTYYNNLGGTRRPGGVLMRISAHSSAGCAQVRVDTN